MIKHIVHTADWHLEPKKNHKKFLNSIEAFIVSVEKETSAFNSDEILIIIQGDLFDNKTKEPSNEAFSIMLKVLKRISDKWKTVVAIGNHDYDINNRTTLDCLTPINDAFAAFGWDRLIYLKHTGIFEIENVLLCNYSNYDGNTKPEIPIHTDKTKVGLYHDVLRGAVNFMNYDLTEGHDNIPDVDIFDGCDFVIMGDIHKHQVLPSDIPVVYSGSLYQLNFGESVNGHGWVLWNVEEHSFKFIEIQNDYALYNVTVDSYEDALVGNFRFKNL